MSVQIKHHDEAHSVNEALLSAGLSAADMHMLAALSAADMHMLTMVMDGVSTTMAMSGMDMLTMVMNSSSTAMSHTAAALSAASGASTTSSTGAAASWKPSVLVSSLLLLPALLGLA